MSCLSNLFLLEEWVTVLMHSKKYVTWSTTSLLREQPSPWLQIARLPKTCLLDQKLPDWQFIQGQTSQPFTITTLRRSPRLCDWSILTFRLCESLTLFSDHAISPLCELCQASRTRKRLTVSSEIPWGVPSMVYQLKPPPEPEQIGASAHEHRFFYFPSFGLQWCRFRHRQVSEVKNLVIHEASSFESFTQRTPTDHKMFLRSIRLSFFLPVPSTPIMSLLGLQISKLCNVSRAWPSWWGRDLRTTASSTLPSAFESSPAVIKLLQVLKTFILSLSQFKPNVEVF